MKPVFMYRGTVLGLQQKIRQLQEKLPDSFRKELEAIVKKATLKS